MPRLKFLPPNNGHHLWQLRRKYSNKAQQIIDSGAKLVFCAETVDKRIMHQLADNGICVLASIEKSGAEDVALATGALMIDHVDSIDEQAWVI